MSRPVQLLGCALLVAALAACGAGGGQNGTEGQGKKERKAPTMDMQQAGQRSEAILDGTLAAIHPSVKWAYGAPAEAACSTGLNEPTDTTTVTRSRNILTVVSEQRRGNLLGLVQRYWERQGFRVVSANSDKDMPRIRARDADGFTVSLEVGNIGNVSVSAGLGCAENSAMTYPTGTPGHPGGPKAEELRPREHSAFWSSNEPLRQ
ncbi:hypothetical protein OG306_13825 [Streptomyces sp. NBC_01241]|uniref:hypothetical protein n=1 Tax=Streptomyces sp. NBC_01241 TaxID=2903794 RepID=UPI00352E37AB|nr:hypothetical protein OG306_13825 [Streptomyces sp. NBC_01241]